MNLNHLQSSLHARLCKLPRGAGPSGGRKLLPQCLFTTSTEPVPRCVLTENSLRTCRKSGSGQFLPHFPRRHVLFKGRVRWSQRQARVLPLVASLLLYDNNVHRLPLDSDLHSTLFIPWDDSLGEIQVPAALQRTGAAHRGQKS